MYGPTNIFSDKLRWIIGGAILLVATVLLILLLAPPAEATVEEPAANSAAFVGVYDGPNAVANGLSSAADQVVAVTDSTGKAFSRNTRSIGNTLARSGAAVGHGIYTGVSFVGKGLASAAGFTARTTARAISGTIAFVVSVPTNILSFTTDTAVVSAVIKPAEKTPVPVIDTKMPIALAQHAEMPAAQTVSHAVPDTAAPKSVWPMHGDITTRFGVPHWPYQPTHTGLDISDGNRSGVTPVKPFRPGTIVNVVRSYSGLGNNVVVDHGNGLTSVYAHLYSINAAVGQIVDTNSVVGTQGSTGASTGTHLHFEIRINGVPTDPLPYLQ